MSGVLSMAHQFYTPTLPRDSTVFMTPSSSSGKPVYFDKPRATPLAFSLPSPDSTPVKRGKTTTQGSTDVLTGLYMSGVPHIVETILAMLPPKALCSALQVSQTWNELISTNSQCTSRIKEYRKKCKQNAENFGDMTEKFTTVTFHPSRQRALSIVDQNLQVSVSAELLQKKQLHPLYLPQTLTQSSQKFRPCPNCQSPAKELTYRRSECTNTNCRFDFCQQCFMSWHEQNECPRKARSSPKRPRSDKIAGTSKSKKRLRRL